MFIVKNLHAETEEKEILKGVDLTVKPGEIHVIMGQNGAGKSTFAKAVAGHPAYEVTSGSVLLNEEELLEVDAEVRAAKGLFISFQYPIEVPGVSNELFLKTALNSQRKERGEEEMSEAEFQKELKAAMELLDLKSEMSSRDLNVGFSGGEKKRNEILQMALLKPNVAILDETDSGLDVDALRTVGEGVMKLMNDQMGLVVITHYQRLLEFITPDFVHLMSDGKIVKSGGKELAKELDEEGYKTVQV